MPRLYNAPPLPLGPRLIGQQITLGGSKDSDSQSRKRQAQEKQQQQQQASPPQFSLTVRKLLGEGGFSFVYLVSEDGNASSSDDEQAPVDTTQNQPQHRRNSLSSENGSKRQMVLKITTVQNREMRDIADKEAMLLRNLSHPSILKLYDDCFRGILTSVKGTENNPSNRLNHMLLNLKEKHNRDKEKDKDKDRDSGDDNNSSANNEKKHANGRNDPQQPQQTASSLQHMMLLEYCSEGHLMSHVMAMAADKQPRYTLPKLIIAFGQICNAVSYLHAQRPPIVHRDLKLENFLLCQGGECLKLCDFGSAVFGKIPLRTQKERSLADDVIQKTTTQMYRAPEMVDLYMKPYLTEATDTWALGCCLYTMAFLKNCFEEGSNLAILSGNYKIPRGNPYGDGLVQMIGRMLQPDADLRADMTEVIKCLSSVYSGKPLPPRKHGSPKGVSSLASQQAHPQERESTPNQQERPELNHVPSVRVAPPTTVVDGIPDQVKEREFKLPHEVKPRHRRQGSNSSGVKHGTYRTDGQGITDYSDIVDGTPVRKGQISNNKLKAVAKKLNPNSAAARRRRAALKQSGSSEAPPTTEDASIEQLPHPLLKTPMRDEKKNYKRSISPSSVGADTPMSTGSYPGVVSTTTLSTLFQCGAGNNTTFILPPSSAAKTGHRPSSSASSYTSSAASASEISSATSGMEHTEFDDGNFQFDAFGSSSENPFASACSSGDEADQLNESQNDDPFGVAKWGKSPEISAIKKLSRKTSMSTAFCGSFDVFNTFASSRDLQNKKITGNISRGKSVKNNFDPNDLTLNISI